MNTPWSAGKLDARAGADRHVFLVSVVVEVLQRSDPRSGVGGSRMPGYVLWLCGVSRQSRVRPRRFRSCLVNLLISCLLSFRLELSSGGRLNRSRIRVAPPLPSWPARLGSMTSRAAGLMLAGWLPSAPGRTLWQSLFWSGLPQKGSGPRKSRSAVSSGI